jgi:hypothetical protein
MPKGRRGRQKKTARTRSPLRDNDDDSGGGDNNDTDFQETFTQKIEKKKYSKTLFSDKEGRPLSFYVAPSESKDKLIEYIQVQNPIIKLRSPLTIENLPMLFREVEE